MSKIFVEDTEIQYIADAIREKNGEEIKYLPSEMGNVIRNIEGKIKEEPETDDIPLIFFSKAIPQNKTNVVTEFRYISNTMDVSGYAEFKAQGTSSMSYPKKNMTVKLYKDEALTEKLKINFKGWGEQCKHVYKANWIDITHARNVVSARIWGDVVKSRSDYSSLPEELRTSPNQGAVDGFPVKVYSQGIYQGRYTLNIPKDAWMANMEDELDNHCILCGENYGSGCFRESANIDGSDWSDEVHDTVPESIKTRWNEVISFVMNSSDEEFVANLENYFFVDSLIDYYIYGLVSCGLDAFGKNQIYFTYDGIKWIASMYDMDSTWGLYWNGSKILSSNYARTSYEDYVNSSGNLLYVKLERLFHEEIKTRYTELKNGVLSIPNLINHFEKFINIASSDLVKEDYATSTGNGTFSNIPSQQTNNIQQIRRFIVDRYKYCDKYIANIASSEPDEPLNSLYSLAEPMTFDGTSNYIDTGIKLYDEDKDFAIWLEFIEGYNEDYSTLLHCTYEVEPWQGLTLNRQVNSFVLTVFGTTQIQSQFNPSGVTRFVITKNGNYYSAHIMRNTFIEPELIMEGTPGYSEYDGNLLIGAYQSIDGVKGRFWNGTVNKCEVFVGENLPSSDATRRFLVGENAGVIKYPYVLNGSNYIDTGVKLYDTDKDFVVLMEFERNQSNAQLATLMHCMTEVSPWNGVVIKEEAEGLHYTCNGQYGSKSFIEHSSTGKTKIAFIKTGSVTTLKTMHDGIVEPAIITSEVGYTQVDNTLLIGAYQDNTGTKGRFWKGVIHSLEVYTETDLPTDEMINEFLTE